MSFSPEIYGQTVSSVLNALVCALETRNQPYNQSLYHTFTQPSGTAFEVDLLLSCTGLDHSPFGRVVNSATSRDMVQGGDGELLRAFGNPIRCSINTTGFHYPTVVHTVMRIRSHLPKMTSIRKRRSGNAFKDTLFGPRVAKALNALLAFEVWVASGSRDIKFTHSAILGNHLARRPYALCIEEGTAYAADVLTVQHNFPLLGLTKFLWEAEPRADFGLMDALFPAFCAEPSKEPEHYTHFAESVTAAMRNLRIEMFYTTPVTDQNLVHVVPSAVYPCLGETDHEFMSLVTGMEL